MLFYFNFNFDPLILKFLQIIKLHSFLIKRKQYKIHQDQLPMTVLKKKKSERSK
jgi:hypothetical protein